MAVVLMMGSNALREWDVEIDRPNLDIDLITSIDGVKEILEKKPSRFRDIKYSGDANHIYFFPQSKGDKIFDIEIAWEDSVSEKLIELVLDNGLYLYTEEGYLAVHPDVVLTLKVSHKYKKNSRHFLKTMRDIQMLKSLGYRIPSCLKEWLKERKRWTYNYKHPKLDGVSKKEFFNDDGINYVYDHDSIHEAVKNLEQPAYKYFQPEGEEVGTSKEMFFECPEQVRLYAVLEEAYVLSLERSIIPFNLQTYEDRKRAFDTALEKVCTSITSGWFRKFAWDNFDKVNELYDQEYVHRFWAAVEAGKVAPYDKEKAVY